MNTSTTTATFNDKHGAVHRRRRTGILLGGLMLLGAALGLAGAKPAAAQPGSAVVATFQGNGGACRAEGACVLGGGGRSILPGTFHLNAGTVVVRARHEGKGLFTVGALLLKPGVDPADGYDLGFGPGFLTFGRFDGAGVFTTHRSGEYALSIDADGPFAISIEQPTAANTEGSMERSFHGSDSQVALVNLPAGQYTITATSTGTTTYEGFKVQLVGLEQEVISPDGARANYLLFGDAPFSGTATFTIPAEGAYVLAVSANGMGGDWTVTIE